MNGAISTIPDVPSNLRLSLLFSTGCRISDMNPLLRKSGLNSVKSYVSAHIKVSALRRPVV
jgi:hypothetical protein